MSAPPASQVSSPSAGLVVGGYVAALFIPLIGLILGITVLKKYDGVGTNHGHWIIAASIASAVVGFLMLAGSSG